MGAAKSKSANSINENYINTADEQTQIIIIILIAILFTL